MANYYATIRTNYFSVKDENAFRELMQSVGAEDEVHIFEQPQSDGSKKLGFGCYGNIYGIPAGPDEDDSEDDMDCFLDALQNLVCEDDAIIMTEVGNEKLRYMIGCSTVITSKEIQDVDIQDKAQYLAQELLGKKITRLRWITEMGIKVLSCGAGMQSTALALMSCENALSANQD